VHFSKKKKVQPKMAAPAKLNEFWGKNKYGRQNTEADKPAVNILSRNVLHLLFPFCIQ
jgi:hypothetical protein